MQKYIVRCVAHIRGVGEPDYNRYFSEVLLAYDETDAEWEMLDKVEEQLGVKISNAICSLKVQRVA